MARKKRTASATSRAGSVPWLRFMMPMLRGGRRSIARWAARGSGRCRNIAGCRAGPIDATDAPACGCRHAMVICGQVELPMRLSERPLECRRAVDLDLPRRNGKRSVAATDEHRNTPYDGYCAAPTPAADAERTHVEKGLARRRVAAPLLAAGRADLRGDRPVAEGAHVRRGPDPAGTLPRRLTGPTLAPSFRRMIDTRIVSPCQQRRQPGGGDAARSLDGSASAH
jgi:hypothetical protein